MRRPGAGKRAAGRPEASTRRAAGTPRRARPAGGIGYTGRPMLARSAACSTSGPAKAGRSPTRSCTSRSPSPPSCSPSRSATACSSQEFGAYKLVYVYVAVPAGAGACSCRSTRRSPSRVGQRAGHHRQPRCSSAPTSLRVLVGRSRYHRAPVAGGGLLRLGELLRRHRAGAGVDVRQRRVRHPAGPAPVRRRRQRRVASAPSSAACWRSRWSAPLAARSTCCSCSPCSSRSAAVVVNLALARAAQGAGPRAARGDRRVPFGSDARGSSRDTPLPAVARRARLPRGDRHAVDAVPVPAWWPTEYFGGDADRLTRFFGTFNFVMGVVAFVVQIAADRARCCGSSASASRSCCCRCRSAFGSV